MKQWMMALVLGIFAANAIADAPIDWQKWTSINTTLTGIGALPDCTANVSDVASDLSGNR